MTGSVNRISVFWSNKYADLVFFCLNQNLDLISGFFVLQSKLKSEFWIFRSTKYRYFGFSINRKSGIRIFQSTEYPDFSVNRKSGFKVFHQTRIQISIRYTFNRKSGFDLGFPGFGFSAERKSEFEVFFG